MRKIIPFALVLAALVLAVGCAVTDYPVITDSRGDYSGVIRTGHKAYIEPTSQVATIYPDGSDELFSMVYQNQYGDQKLYTFNNFDPTGSVNLMDFVYCDWRYDGCEITRAWNPANSAVDNSMDYEFFPDCSGARSLSLLLQESGRVGECGDGLAWAGRQGLASEFANLATTTWRGTTAYIVPVDSSNTTIALTAGNGATQTVPLFGSFNMFVNEKGQTIVPMTPNTRHELRWLSQFAAQNGNAASASINYGSFSTTVNVGFAKAGLDYNVSRF